MAGKKTEKLKAEPAKTTAASPGPGHNRGSGLDPAAEMAFIREFQNVKDQEGAMAGAKGVLAGIFKRLESFGFTKEHIAFAKALEKRNTAEVLADLEMKVKICRIVGHPAGRQLDFLGTDRAPIEDKAYEDGLAVGKLGKSSSNPYGMETMAGQRWQQGVNEGNIFRNKAFADAIEADSLIKSSDDEGDEDEQSPEDEQNEDTTAGVDDDVQTEEAALDGEVIAPGDPDNWDNDSPPVRRSDD